MSDFPSPDEWLANEPHEVEMVPENDPREECSRCLLLFDARDWPDCPRCLSAEKQAPIDDFEWERTPTEPLGHKVERRLR